MNHNLNSHCFLKMNKIKTGKKEGKRGKNKEIKEQSVGGGETTNCFSPGASLKINTCFTKYIWK